MVLILRASQDSPAEATCGLLYAKRIDDVDSRKAGFLDTLLLKPQAGFA